MYKVQWHEVHSIVVQPSTPYISKTFSPSWSKQFSPNCFLPASGSHHSTSHLCTFWLLFVLLAAEAHRIIFFCDCLISQSMMSSRVIHTVAYVWIAFLYKVDHSPLLWLNHIQSTQSLAYGPLNCFWLLFWIMLLWIWIGRYVFKTAFNYFGDIFRSGILETFGNPIFNFLRNCCSGYPIWHFYQVCPRVSISLAPVICFFLLASSLPPFLSPFLPSFFPFFLLYFLSHPNWDIGG